MYEVLFLNEYIGALITLACITIFLYMLMYHIQLSRSLVYAEMEKIRLSFTTDMPRSFRPSPNIFI